MMLLRLDKLIKNTGYMLVERNANIIKDLNGNKIVLISDVIFKGKKSVDWDDVRTYLESYVDEFYEIADTKNISEVQQMAGTDTILVLRFQFMRTMARFTNIMCSMHPY